MNERVERMVDAALLKAGGGLVKRLRDGREGWLANNLSAYAADRIEQLELELAEAEENLDAVTLFWKTQLVAEKALADELAEVARSYFDREEVSARNAKLCIAVETYRKARGL